MKIAANDGRGTPVTQRTQANVVDNLRNTPRSVVSWPGELLHHWRLHSPLAAHCPRHPAHQHHSRKAISYIGAPIVLRRSSGAEKSRKLPGTRSVDDEFTEGERHSRLSSASQSLLQCWHGVCF